MFLQCSFQESANSKDRELPMDLSVVLPAKEEAENLRGYGEEGIS
jgi:hypothetical protein